MMEGPAEGDLAKGQLVMLHPKRAVRAHVCALFVLLSLAAPLQASVHEVRTAAATQALFISSYSDGTIVRIDLGNLSQRVILSGLPTPEGGTCSADGNLFFAEPSSGRIVRFGANGSGMIPVLDVSGIEPEGPSLSPDGDLFYNTRLSADGAVWRIPGAVPGAVPAQATAVYTRFGEGTAFLRSGRLLAVDTFGGNVYEFSPPFNATNGGRVFASGTPYWGGVTVGPAGDVFVANSSGGSILRFTSSGQPLGVYATGIRYPQFLQFDSEGNLYVTDFVYQAYPGQMDSVVRISPNGTQTTIAYIRGALGLALCTLAGLSGSPNLQGGMLDLLVVLAIILTAGAGFFAVAYQALSKSRASSLSAPIESNKTAPSCLGCGGRVDPSDVYCRACGRPLR